MSKATEAQELLFAIEEHTDGDFATGALVGIGYALLDVAAAIREQTAEIKALVDDA